MRKLVVFNQVSLDGYFTNRSGDMGWTHQQDDDQEFREFVAGNASGGGVLVFGRKTYQMMNSFWPTPMAAQQFPVVAEQMNALPKIVFSRTLAEASWNNTTLLKGDPVDELRRLKQTPGDSLVIMGSGSLVAPLARAGLIDEYELVTIPVALGDGRTMFDGLGRTLELSLQSTRTFRNGKLFSVYQPAA